MIRGKGSTYILWKAGDGGIRPTSRPEHFNKYVHKSAMPCSASEWGAICTLIAERAGQGGLALERMCELSGEAAADFTGRKTVRYAPGLKCQLCPSHS
jgi:hypothetical protein